MVMKLKIPVPGNLMSNIMRMACSTRRGGGDLNSFLRKWLSAEPQLLETVLVGFFFSLLGTS